MSYDCFYFSMSVSIAEHADAGVSRVKSVLHNEATVKKEPLQEVVGSDKYRINNLLDEQHERRPIQDILQLTESLVGKTLPYCLCKFNCEHFVTLMRYRTPQSQQVQHDLTYRIKLYP